MIGLDTNVLVRYAAQDDAEQSALADSAIERLTESEPGFVSTVTLAESTWVLRRVYRVGAPEIATFVRHLLGAREIVVENTDAVRRALLDTDGDERFTDALIAEIGIEAGCEYTLTFDRRAAALPGGRLLTAS
jgi:predicted nucleic-acid-binding protein